VKSVFCIMVVILISACSSKPDVVPLGSVDTAEETVRKIYIVNHGWHTGLVLPASLIQSRIPELQKRFGDINYIEFGWGDEGFYQAEEVTSGLTLRALFWASDTVVHAVAVSLRPEIYFPSSQLESICLTRREYSSLVKFVENSFSRDENGRIVATKKGIYGNSQFYQGSGDYYFMNTCNKWTAKALKSAGLDISPRFKLTADSVMDSIIGIKHNKPRFKCSAKQDIAE